MYIHLSGSLDLQILCGEDGVVGSNIEHTAVDATIVMTVGLCALHMQ